MPRPERPVDPEDGPVARFAVGLRELRRSAGSPGYRELARLAHYSPTTLAQAARGEGLPSLAVTLAYVRACGGDAEAWETRWRATAAELGSRASRASAADTTAAGRAPYVGLAAYAPEDAEWFCGRDQLVAALNRRVSRERFVAVVGASGAGKTSVLRAGLLPAVLADQGRGSAVVLTPGAHPLEECAVWLGGELGLPASRLAAEFAEHPRNLGLGLRQLLARRQEGPEFVLVVDQFEEVFTHCHDAVERNRFVDALLEAAHGPDSRTRVVVGLRADFYGHCTRHPQLVEALQDAQVLVGPMNADELVQAITQPAARAGLMVEKTLVTTVVHDAAQRPGALPFVSHALWETWRRRHGNGLFLADYQAIGGVNGAIANTADRLYRDLDERQQRTTRDILLRLTALGEGVEDTHRRVSRSELLDVPDPDVVTAVLGKLAAARLVTLGTDTVEVAHEALLRSWPKLRSWLTEDRDTVLAHQRLTEAAAEWERRGRDEGLLYRGVRLADWQDRSLDRLNDTERALLAASRHAASEEHRARRRRVRVTIAAVTAAVVLVTVLALIAMFMAGRADDERARAAGLRLAADARTHLPYDPELALLLAREAYSIAPDGDTEALLRQATVDSHVRATLPGRGDLTASTGVAFSRDGHHLVTSGVGELRLWDWNAGHLSRTAPRVLEGRPGERLSNPVFSPDGRRLAATDSGGAWVWDRAGSDEPVRFPGAGASKVRFSPDGQRVAVAEGSTIRIWHTAGNGRPDRELRVQAGKVLDLVFSPDGRRLTSGGSDSTVHVWDLVGGGKPSVSHGRERAVRAMVFSPNGRDVATAGTDGTIRARDCSGGGDSSVLGSHADPHALAYSPDGHWLVSTSSRGTVHIWNADHRGPPTVLLRQDATVEAAEFSPDGTSVVTVSALGTTKVWDLDEVRDLTVLRGHRGPVAGAVPSPDGRHVASGGKDGTVLLWDIEGDNAPVVLPGPGRPVTDLTFSHDGHHLAAAGEDGTLLIWNTGDLAEPVRLRAPDRLYQVVFSPDSKRVAATNAAATVWIWNTNGTGEPDQLSNGDQPGSPSRIAWRPDGRYIAVSHENFPVIWDLRAPADPVAVLHGPHSRIGTLEFSPDGSRLVSGDDDGMIYRWEFGGTARLSSDALLRIRPLPLRGHQGMVWSTTFSSDGRRLTSTGADGTVRMWKATGDGEPLVLDGFRASVETVASLGEDRYVTAHDDGTVRVWRCPACGPIADVLARGRRHVTRELTAEERRTYLPANP